MFVWLVVCGWDVRLRLAVSIEGRCRDVTGLHHSTQTHITNRYFYANVVYCFYCTGMLLIDFVGYNKEFTDKVCVFFGKQRVAGGRRHVPSLVVMCT